MQTLTAHRRRLIIYAWPYVEWGGVQIYFLNLLRRAVPEFDVRAAFPAASSPTLLGYLSALSVEYDELPARSESFPVSGLLARARRRFRKLRSESVFRRHLLARATGTALFQVDVAPWSSYRFLASLARHSPTFVTIHTRLPEPGRWRRPLWKRRLRRLARTPRFHLIAASRDVRDSLVPYLGSWVEDNVPIAYPGIDLTEIDLVRSSPKDRGKLVQSLGLQADRTLVTVAGQFIDRKGCWTFLEAVAQLKERYPKLFFLWLGMEELPPETALRIARFAGQESFRYVPSHRSGATHHSFLGTLSTLTDILVLPSLVEGLPLVLVEAMALAKPIVTTNINGIPEALEHEHNGLLVSPGRADELVNAIALLADHPELARHYGEAARRTAVARFDQRLTTRVTLEAYRAAITLDEASRRFASEDAHTCGS